MILFVDLGASTVRFWTHDDTSGACMDVHSTQLAEPLEEFRWYWEEVHPLPEDEANRNPTLQECFAWLHANHGVGVDEFIDGSPRRHPELRADRLEVSVRESPVQLGAITNQGVAHSMTENKLLSDRVKDVPAFRTNLIEQDFNRWNRQQGES